MAKMGPISAGFAIEMIVDIVISIHANTAVQYVLLLTADW
jgi:hypothetical protein